MDLFENIKGKPENRLPQDGIVNYYGTLMSQREANDYFNSLLSKVTWMNDEVIIFGKRIVTKRKMAWYGEKPFDLTPFEWTRFVSLSPFQIAQDLNSLNLNACAFYCNT